MVIKLDKDITIKKSFKDIPASSWDKIIIPCDGPGIHHLHNRIFGLNWRNFETAVLNNPQYIAPSRDKFASQEAFDDTVKVFPNAWHHLSNMYTMKTYNSNSFMRETALRSPFVFTDGLFRNFNASVPSRENNVREGNALFSYLYKNGDACKIKSKEVLEFLQKYSKDDYKFDVTYPAGVEVNGSEVGLPESTPVPTPAPSTPSTTTGGGTSGSSGGGGLSAIGGNRPTTGSGRTAEAQSAKSAQSEKNGFVLMGLISSLIITITAIAIIWRRKKTKI